MKIYMITGEQSGDVYGANLAKELFIQNNQIKIRAFGGDKMKEEGVELAKHIHDFSIMGFTEVLKNIVSISNNLNYCKKDIIKFNPLVLVLIDFPGFNLRIAKFAKQKGIKVVYYISPKVWAWNKSRIFKIKKYVDELIVIFPFEVEFYKKFNIGARYFGNPLYECLNTKLPVIKRDKKIISILPGSRTQEVKRNLRVMLKMVPLYSEYQFIIASTKDMYELCKEFIGETKNIELLVDQTHSILKSSQITIVTSGTATLEAALLKTPQIVCYKTDSVTYLLAKLFLNLSWISLVNILMNREVVNELIQSEMNNNNLKREIDVLLSSNNKKMLSDYQKIDKLLESNNVSKKIASFIISIN
tara:strand:- start:4827 stop:5903 length:1077 start_codon:yes stop_codon:yes gene_type:complete